MVKSFKNLLLQTITRTVVNDLGNLTVNCKFAMMYELCKVKHLNVAFFKPLKTVTMLNRKRVISCVGIINLHNFISMSNITKSSCQVLIISCQGDVIIVEALIQNLRCISTGPCFSINLYDRGY